MTIWFPLTIFAWLYSYSSKEKSFLCLLFFSLLTGASIISSLNIGNKAVGIQPVYIILYASLYLIFINHLSSKRAIHKLPKEIEILFVLTIYSIIVSIFHSKVNYGQFFYILSIPFITLFTYILAKEISGKKIIESILGISLIVFIYGIIEVLLRYFNLPTLEKILINNISVANNNWAKAYSVPRANSVFAEPSYLGAYSAVILLFCVSIYLSNKNNKISYLKTTTGLSFINLLLSASFLGIGMTVAGLLLLFIIILLNGSKEIMSKLIKFMIIVIIIFIPIYIILEISSPIYVESIKSWIIMRFQFSDGSTIQRTTSLSNGYNIGLNNLFGVGLGNFISADLFSTIAGAAGIFATLFLAIWFIILMIKSRVITISDESNLDALPYFIIIFTLFIAFCTGLGHTVILWPWVLIGVSIQKILSIDQNK